MGISTMSAGDTDPRAKVSAVGRQRSAVDLPPSVARHIVLIGLPGAGKTTVGRALARRLGRPFVDFDEEIVRREGRTISTIFASEGEAYFRRLESRLTTETLSGAASVLSPGGGWVVEPGLLESARASALLVHLRVSLTTAVRRMGSEAKTRPLLAGPDLMVTLERLWTTRRERYALADVEIDTEMLDSEEVAGRIHALIDRSAS